MSPIPRVSGEIMCSGLFHKTGVLAECICMTGLKEENQLTVFPILELDGPSCEATGKSSSTDVSPCVSVEECHLFGSGDCLGSGLGEVIAGGCPSVWGALADRIHHHDDDDCPNGIW